MLRLLQSLVLSPVMAFGFSALGQAQISKGLYKGVSELCSDGTVYTGDTDVLTSTRKDIQFSMEFLDKNQVRVAMANEKSPETSGEYVARYSLDPGGVLRYIEVVSISFPENSSMTKESMEAYLLQLPAAVISTNGIQLILSSPGFNGHGRCTPPAFTINIFEKVK
ncbi:MAG: hypothetical protein H6624_16125 [Bdellovibrionaceae bacterium]|nr:hypothetical protein [Bdellovibrionales bacterium]MCB9085876.1 hypothetical protein [Pseudobdellovibrionaceae bacterium]